MSILRSWYNKVLMPYTGADTTGRYLRADGEWMVPSSGIAAEYHIILIAVASPVTI